MNERAAERTDIERTGELMCEARRLLAYGGLDGVVRRPLYYDDEHVFPQFVAQARGCEFVDSTGQSFVDWVNGWGPVMLGYRRPEVEQAIVQQLACGPTLSLMHPIEVEVARLLSEMFPCADMVAFGKNGSDAVTAAVRVARAVTGREVILHYGWHGFHDWFIGSMPGVRGIPNVLRTLVHSFPYNDLDSLRALFAEHRGRVAAVLMEPVREIHPEPGYLAAVRDLTHAEGALLVYDEIVTAFRLANGGAQELYGVVPDLACLGKSMGNGMPISALVGRREYMQHLPSVGVGMTFRGETLSLAAARAVLRILRGEPVAAELARIGEQVRARFDRASAERGMATRLLGPPARMTFGFVAAPNWSPDRQRELFVQESIKRGVFTNGNMLASLAHDAAAIERTLAGFEGALDVLARALGGERRDDRPIGGALGAPRAMVATGFVESLIERPDALHVAGWMLLDDGPADLFRIRGADGWELDAPPTLRPDVGQAFPHLAGAERSGFALSVPAARWRDASEHDFTLCAVREGQIAFRCRVVRQRAAARSPIPGPMSIVDGVLYL
jgi:glutamate-1-semialdehyde aminotransferase